ncbi:MAG: LysR family transcriptional regulator ArgP [Hydrogenophaga sp.]|uniref:LysR family transcriptional regulator ArgP n=1 Tax=Hydrogenophaga sp. TaxID=1904254 RepID=UPI00403727D0
MLDYSALNALSAVVREGSFERAARVLNVTPSAISQRIRLLEERVGCALVVREQPCVPTKTGRDLCQHIDRVRLLEDDLKTSVPSLATEGDARVPIPVAVNADSLATWFAPALATFAAGAPVLMEIAVDDQDHTAEWLRSGAVMGAVTGNGRSVPGCSLQPLGAMQYVAAASPDFVSKHFPNGVSSRSLSAAPSLVFNAKDELQDRWAHRICRRHVELPRHVLPSAHAFVTATLSGMGWGLHPHSLIAHHLKNGSLVALVAESNLQVPLHWQVARAASSLLDGLTKHLVSAARKELAQP